MEPVNDAYGRWTEEQSGSNMASILTALKPTINSEIQRYPGPKPLLRSRAKSLAIGAVKSYDPTSKAQLRSWVVTSLQPLSRYGYEVSNPLHASEVARRQAAEVEEHRKRLVDDLGDEPTDAQLSDSVGISTKRIGDLRKRVRAVAAEGSFVNEGGETVEPAVNVVGTDPALTTATEMVYESLDARDRSIFEFKTGYKGKQELDNQSIAKRLGVTPAFVSQRSAVVTQMIMETMTRV